MLLSEKMCIFIVFTSNVDNLRITEVLEWLSVNKKSYHLMIFTSKKHSTINCSDLCSIINLKNSYDKWWEMDDILKRIVYTEIYEEFIKCLNSKNIIHSFPSSLSETEDIWTKLTNPI